MKFYFCEKCGKRVSDRELEAGAAKDKKVKGIFCLECAVGVTTRAFEPITPEEERAVERDINPPDERPGAATAKKPARRTTGNLPVPRSEFTPAVRRKTTGATRRPNKRASGPRSTSGTSSGRSTSSNALSSYKSSARMPAVRAPQRIHEPGESNSNTPKIAMGVLVAVFLMLGMIMMMGGQTPPRGPASSTVAQSPRPAANPYPKRNPLPSTHRTGPVNRVGPGYLQPPPTQPEKGVPGPTLPAPNPSLEPAPRIDHGPATEPEPEKPQDAEKTPEELASAAYDDLSRNLDTKDTAGSIKQLEVFLDKHGEALIAAQARVLLEKLKRENAADEPDAPVVASGTEPFKPSKEPVLHLKLDDSDGTTASDASKRDHHGTIEGDPGRETGKVGGAFEFDGKKDRVIVGGVPVDTRRGSTNTVTFWMKWSGKGHQAPFGWDGKYSFLLLKDRMGISLGRNNLLGCPIDGIAKRWVHVAALFPNGVPSTENVKLFIDGKAMELKAPKKKAKAEKAATSKLYLSGWGGAPGGRFKGALDDVRIYNRALSQSEIQALVKAAEPPKPLAKATFVKRDDKTKGTWKGVYGEAGYFLPGFKSDVKGQIEKDVSDVLVRPTWLLDLQKTGNSAYRWPSDTDKRCVQSPDGEGRRGTGDYGNLFIYNLRFKDLKPHRIAMYLVDFDELRTQEVEILDASTGSLLNKQSLKKEDLKSGLYLIWDIAGDVRIRFKKTEGHNAVCNALFFDPPPDPRHKQRLKDLPVACAAWRTGDTAAIEKQTQSLVEKDKPLAEILQSALRFRAAAVKKLKELEGKKSLTLSFKKGGDRLGRITKADGVSFEFQTATRRHTFKLPDLSLQTRGAWAEKALDDASQLPALAAAAAMLDGQYEEARSALAKAEAKADDWRPFLAVLKARVGSDKNAKAWEEIEKLARPGKWEDFVLKASAFQATPPSGSLSPDLKKTVGDLLATARKALKSEWLRPERLGLNAPARVLPDGRLEIIYSLAHPRQMLDFGTSAARRCRWGNGEMRSKNVDLRHKVPFEGDLDVSYEIQSRESNPKNVFLRFYDYHGEFGGGNNEWTAIWRVGSDPNRPIKKKPGLGVVQAKWHHIQIEYRAQSKQTRILIDAVEVIKFTDKHCSGRGSVQLGARVTNKIRNIRIRGKPSLALIEAAKRKSAFAADLKKRMAGKMVKLFTQEDKPYWNTARGSKWSLNKGEVRGEKYINVLPFPQVNFELKLEMRLAGGKEARMRVRYAGSSIYRVKFGEGKVVGELVQSDRRKNKVFKEVTCDPYKWHKLHVQSHGGILHVTLDGKHVLMNLRNVPYDHRGFAIVTQDGWVGIRKAEARLLR